MKCRIAEGELGDSRTLHVEADVVFVGHPDAGKDLYALIRREHVRVGAAGLGERDEA